MAGNPVYKRKIKTIIPAKMPENNQRFSALPKRLETTISKVIQFFQTSQSKLKGRENVALSCTRERRSNAFLNYCDLLTVLHNVEHLGTATHGSVSLQLLCGCSLSLVTLSLVTLIVKAGMNQKYSRGTIT